MKKILYVFICILLLAGTMSTTALGAETEAEGYLFELGDGEINAFLNDVADPDVNWSRLTHGHTYLRPSFPDGETQYSKAPGGGILISDREKYWHALDIRHEWMTEDYTYDIEVSFKSDTPVIFAITNIPALNAPDTEILAITTESSTSATLTYTLSNDNRTGGQRGVRLIAIDDTADFTVASIRIHQGEIILFPWWIVQLVLGALALAGLAYVIVKAITVERFRQKLPDRVFVVCNTLFMCAIVVIMLYPFLNVLAYSFNDPQDSIRGNIYLWPRIWTLKNYEQVFKNARLLTAFTNSIARTILATAGGIFVCSMAAYVLSRREFMWNKFVTVFFLMTMYVSAGLIPTFFLYRDLGLVSNFNVYWVPGLFGAFNVIVIRTYMNGLPDSLVEAGRLDGAGEFRIFMQIIFPICKPVLATVGLWMAVGNWNDWFTTFIYAPFNDSLTTLQYELMRELSNTLAMMGQQSSEALAQQGNIEELSNVTPIAIRNAITIVATMPILCVYPFLQKYFVKGVHVGSVKG